MVFKTIPNENNLSGLSISNIFSVNKEAEAESARQLQENLKRLNDYQKGIDELNKTTATSTEYTKLWNNTMVGADADVQAYAKNIKAGTGSVEAYTTAQKEAATATEGVGTASKIAAVGMNALKIAANVAIVTLISWGIEKAVEGIQNLVNADQNAIDKANELTSTYQTNISKINSNTETLEGLKDQFATLSKGVDENGKNIGLTTDQFKQYHDIVKKIVDIDPSLIKGFDDQNNAIVNNNKALSEAIQYEQQQLEIQKQNYLKDSDKTLLGAQDEVKKNTNDAKASVQSFVQELDKAIGLDYDLLNKSNIDNPQVYDKYLEQTKKFKQTFNSIGIDYKKLIAGDADELSKLSGRQNEVIATLKQQNGLTDEQATSLSNIISKISTASNAIGTANQKVVSLVDVWSSLSQNSDWYNKISQSGDLDNFNKAIQHFVEQNPTATIEQIENAAKGLGTSFSSVEPDIDKVNSKVAELKKQQSDGKISADQFNSGINEQAKTLSNLASSLASTNPLLAYFLNLLAQGLADELKDASKSGTDLSNTVTTLNGNINSISSSITAYAKSVKDLNSAIDTQNKGDLLTGEQVSDLIQKYPELTNKVIDTGHGYEFQKGALETVRQEEIKEKEQGIQDAIDKANGVINSVLTQINAYQSLIGTIKTVADAEKALTGDASANIRISGPKMMSDEDTDKQYADARNKLKQYIAASSELDEYKKKLEALKQSASYVGSNYYEKVDNSGYKSSEKAREKAAKAKEAAKKAAEEAKSAAKEAYENELSNLQNNEDSGLYKTKLDFYNALVKFQAKWIKNSYIDNSTKNSLKKKITEALKDYEQDVYDISLKQLSHREEIGQTKSGSIQELQNLQAIYKNLTTNPLMQLVNDDEHRQEINEKIYQNKKQSLENEREELNTEKDLGQIEEGSLEYVNRLKSIKADIEKSDLNAIDKAEKLSDIDKDIYSATQSYNEAQINAVDHLVNIGKLQSNSLEYLKRLNHLYHTLNLSLDDRKSLQEKIFSSEISYISQLKSDLSDELIEGSYGQRIKEYEDEIDDLQQKESDLSDETISNSLGSQIKAIQDKIDAINDQSEAESKALALEKAKAAWEEAQNNKTVQIYTNKNGFVYQADQSAVTEKKQSYAEAQRNEEIEKLTQQKDALQKMLDSEKNSIEVSIKALTKHKESLQSDLQSEQTELEKATKVLQGYDVNSDDLWDDIQNQIDNVLDEVTGNISESTNKHKASYDEENESVTNLTDNTTNSYQSQIKNAQDFIAKFTPVNQQIMDMYNQQANAAQKVADAIYNVNNELDRYIRVINDAENEREEMNEQYNEYNQEARENHQSVHYASGTEDSINGLVKKNEQGYELTFEPTDNGNYEILKEHSKVLTASQTQRIFDLAKGVSPQIATLKANLSLGKIGGNISNRTTKTDITNKYEIKKVEFPNATNKDEIQAAFGSLDLYFKQKAFSNE